MQIFPKHIIIFSEWTEDLKQVKQKRRRRKKKTFYGVPYMFVYKLKVFTYKGLIGENGHSLGRTITLNWEGRECWSNCSANGEYLWHNGNIPRGSRCPTHHKPKAKINICRCVCQALNDCGCSETLTCHFASYKSIFYS